MPTLRNSLSLQARKYACPYVQAVLLGELELAWRQHARSAFEPGELRNYVNAEHIPIGAVIQAW
jgi:hypothetical protein